VQRRFNELRGSGKRNAGKSDQMTAKTWVLCMAIALATMSCSRARVLPPAEPTAEPSEAIRAFRDFALAPARLPPPSVTMERVSVDGAGVRGTARVVRAEEEGWNAWPGRELRLFNHRWAWVVEVSVDGPEGMAWRPQGSRLELNDERTVLLPAPSADDVLGDLLFWALEQERHALGEDLAARTRGAGPFRARYLTQRSEAGRWEGVLAFPLGEHYDRHVVAARLTLAFDLPSGTEELVWVFP